MQENDKNDKKIDKYTFVNKKQQRDPQRDRLVILDVCFDKDGGLVWILGSKSQLEKVIQVECLVRQGLQVVQD